MASGCRCHFLGLEKRTRDRKSTFPLKVVVYGSHLQLLGTEQTSQGLALIRTALESIFISHVLGYNFSLVSASLGPQGGCCTPLLGCRRCILSRFPPSGPRANPRPLSSSGRSGGSWLVSWRLGNANLTNIYPRTGARAGLRVYAKYPSSGPQTEGSSEECRLGANFSSLRARKPRTGSAHACQQAPHLCPGD